MICSFYIYFEKKKQITRKHAFYVIDDVLLVEVLGFIKYSMLIFSREYGICKHGLSCCSVYVQHFMQCHFQMSILEINRNIRTDAIKKIK